MWWCDLSWGVVCCDPLAHEPKFEFIQLPNESALEFADHPAVQGRRSLSISQSRIQYLEISRVGEGPSRITLWNLSAVDDDRMVWHWEESRASISPKYGQARATPGPLPASLPTIAALNPLDA
jgi:hypothetical protein